jgi:hypothetical protein
MKQLIEDYKRRLATVKQLNFEFKSNGSEHDVRKKERFNTKASEFQTFIDELERIESNHIITNLFWHNRNETCNPPENKRILVFSPAYEIGDPMRFRLIDSQFYKLSKDAEYWAVVEEPQEKFTEPII